MSQQLAEQLRQRLLSSKEFSFGEIYLIRDDLISIPDADRKGDRVEHPSRPVVVISNNPENINPICPLLTIAPCSHRTDLATETDIEISRADSGLSQDSLIRLRLSQPILKMDLGTKIGEITEERKSEILFEIERYYGISD